MIFKLFLAFGAGFISFLTPCVLPIIPGYISYITGKDLDEIERDKEVVLYKTIIFSLGFSLIFISLGITASAIGNVLLFFSNELRIVAGLIIILFSLQMLGILNFQFLNKEKRFETSNYKDNYIFPFIVEIPIEVFAFGLDSLHWSSFRFNISFICYRSVDWKWYSFVIFYSLGLAIPFVLSGYYMSRFLVSKKGFGKYYNRVTKSGGAILFITGVLIATNQIQVISYYILTTFPFLTSLG